MNRASPRNCGMKPFCLCVGKCASVIPSTSLRRVAIMETRVASFQKEKLLVVAKGVGKKGRPGAEKMKSFALDSWRYITLANELNYLMYVREKKFGDRGKMC